MDPARHASRGIRAHTGPCLAIIALNTASDKPLLALDCVHPVTAVASGGADSLVRIWNVSALTQDTSEPCDALLETLVLSSRDRAGGPGSVLSMAVSWLGRGHPSLCAGYENGLICLWDVETGAELSVWPASSRSHRPAGIMAVSGQATVPLVLSGSEGGWVAMWDIRQGPGASCPVPVGGWTVSDAVLGCDIHPNTAGPFAWCTAGGDVHVLDLCGRRRYVHRLARVPTGLCWVPLLGSPARGPPRLACAVMAPSLPPSQRVSGVLGAPAILLLHSDTGMVSHVLTGHIHEAVRLMPAVTSLPGRRGVIIGMGDEAQAQLQLWELPSISAPQTTPPPQAPEGGPSAGDFEVLRPKSTVTVYQEGLEPSHGTRMEISCILCTTSWLDSPGSAGEASRVTGEQLSSLWACGTSTGHIHLLRAL